jgi:hypothetical protein
VLSDQELPAIMAPTAHDLLDAFLRGRALEVTGETLARDREVVEWLLAYLDARDRDDARAADLDELAARRVTRSDQPPAEATLGAERIIHEISGFFGVWLPTEVRATALQRQSAGLVVRLLARWLLRCQLVDEWKSREVHHFTQRFAPIAGRAVSRAGRFR